MKETAWKLLKDKVKEKYISLGLDRFPGRRIPLRVTASDLPSNTREDALTGQLESEVFVIDNTPPRITGLSGTRNGQSHRSALARRRRAQRDHTRPNTRWMAASGRWSLR